MNKPVRRASSACASTSYSCFLRHSPTWHSRFELSIDDLALKGSSLEYTPCQCMCPLQVFFLVILSSLRLHSLRHLICVTQVLTVDHVSQSVTSAEPADPSHEGSYPALRWSFMNLCRFPLYWVSVWILYTALLQLVLYASVMTSS
jgi:hypothetical protein